MQTDLHDRLRAELGPELEVLRPLGSGAHADVFLAREPALKRLVAIKVLHPKLAGDFVMRRRFERESQAVAGIRHPNITPVYRVGQLSGDVPFIVMEYVEGRTLSDAMGARVPFPLDEAGPILAAIASALAAAHERGIIHRDVRPGNIFVENRTGRAVLADFGIAALTDRAAEATTQLTTGGVRLGDVRYMSPEQLRAEPVTEQSDVYALGMVAYELLTGHVPFDDRIPVQQVAARLREEPRSPAELRPDLPAPFADTVLRCLAADPNRRPRASELAAFFAGAGAPAPRPEPDTRRGLVEQFFGELKRRRVYRVAGTYLAVGFALVEVANNFVPNLGLPAGTTQVLAVLVVAGFPIALVLSWLFDYTSAGIQRTAGERPGPALARWLPWIGLALSIAFGALALVWMLGRLRPDA